MHAARISNAVRYSLLFGAIFAFSLSSCLKEPDRNCPPLTLSVQVGKVTNLTQLLAGLPGIGALLAEVLNPLNNITVSVPFNLPLLSVSNLTISGKWSTPTPYQN